MNNSDVRSNEETIARMLPDPIDPSLSSINNNKTRREREREEENYIVVVLRIDLCGTYRISQSLHPIITYAFCCIRPLVVAIATDTVVVG